jgi:hypothetical protein
LWIAFYPIEKAYEILAIDLWIGWTRRARSIRPTSGAPVAAAKRASRASIS